MNNINKLIFVLIIVYLIVYLLNKFLGTQEHFSSNIYFLNKDEVKKLLLSNEDGYYDEFGKEDWIARGANDVNDYLKKIEKCCSEYSDSEIKRIKNAIKNVDLFFKNNCNIYWLDTEKLNSIPWKFGIVSNRSYENGLPHTRSDTIMFCSERLKSKSEKGLEALLVHEKMHIYQKMFPEECKKYCDLMGFRKFKRVSKNDSIRANPDTDHYIYKNDSNQKLIGKYNSSNPENLEDAKYYPINEQSFEHPFEHMAIEVEKKYRSLS